MDDIVFAGNRALYLILVMSAGPIAVATFVGLLGNDSNLLIVFYVQIMRDDFVMQLHRF